MTFKISTPYFKGVRKPVPFRVGLEPINLSEHKSKLLPFALALLYNHIIGKESANFSWPTLPVKRFS